MDDVVYSQSDDFLGKSHPRFQHALRVCSVPLVLTQPLAATLLARFGSGECVDCFWRKATNLGLLCRRSMYEWRLNTDVRCHFLAALERDDPLRASEIHAEVLEYVMAKGKRSGLSTESFRLHEAYHSTPVNPAKGNDCYWKTYCLLRNQNRIVAIDALAALAVSQSLWLADYLPYLKLYRAAALHFSQDRTFGEEARSILETLLGPTIPVAVRLDAAFLIGMRIRQTGRSQGERSTAKSFFENVTSLADQIDLLDQPLDVQQHLRRTIAESYFHLGDILEAFGEPGDLQVAEECYRNGIQIVYDEDQPWLEVLEATRLKQLIGFQKRRGATQADVQAWSRRVAAIEYDARTQFWEEAISERGNWDYQYYAISALKHGLGYELQRVNMLVEPDGSAQIEGSFNLRAMSMLSAIDTYLITVPESQVGVHFHKVESSSPEFTLDFRSVGTTKSARVEIGIEPAMRPGEQLAYRWMALASAGTFATTLEQLRASGAEFEYVSWQIIAPMRRLEISVSIPSGQTEPLPPYWFDLWRLGPAPKPGTASYMQAVQTAYRAQLGDGTESVTCSSELEPPGRRRLRLQVQYPWLAMRYVLAWKVE